MNIIGIVGPFASGKGVVTDYLIKKYSYTSFSLSTIVHDEVKKKGITNYDRTILQNTGDELRKKEGDGVLAKRAVQYLKRKNSSLKKIVIEGIRNPGEIAFLRTIPGFILIAVDASQKIRFQRILERKKPWDPMDWDAFKKVDGRDRGDKENTNGQQVKKCMEMADVKIKNEGGVKEVEREIEKILNTKL
ncbi:MAG: AAA family ATPase [Candidatus Roizmanbacteria bacterium]|nr:AAA family ATPase [Candidatus Roizmanbacteria bacterium]